MSFSDCEGFALSQSLRHDSEMLQISAGSTAPSGKKFMCDATFRDKKTVISSFG